MEFGIGRVHVLFLIYSVRRTELSPVLSKFGDVFSIYRNSTRILHNYFSFRHNVHLLEMAHNLNVASYDSPGSSVFDLPIQPSAAAFTGDNTGTGRRRSYLTSQPSEFSDEPSFLVISGGTGGNAICSAFTNACYVLPVSDDGGSSSEIIRVLGGPSIGDVLVYKY